MTTRSILAGLFLCLASLALAGSEVPPSFEDTAEFLAPQLSDKDRPAQHAQRAHLFVLVDSHQRVSTLSSQAASTMLKPASTMKLFTGWLAFLRQARDENFLSKMLKESVNTMADNALAALGGAASMRRYYQQTKVATAGSFAPVDGSGLSYGNQTNCRTEVSLLLSILRDPRYDRFKELLAQPGEHGTLEHRLPGLRGRLFAKTGTLKATAALSGFAETNSGVMVFCVIHDNIDRTIPAERAAIDALVEGMYRRAR